MKTKHEIECPVLVAETLAFREATRIAVRMKMDDTIMMSLSSNFFYYEQDGCAEEYFYIG